ncbi:thioredoxin family protein [Fibrella forsythiae]|uniref:Thioredoxin family protein n=1 Tax=Fibrella forsythiae TaxID=2817061 RepID=A0ABS3JR14_9BACT|nr:thioredoxin family protein [Fibrella forsythiae]MBO0951811.1 thioredoxin family protein [Fibrella forsythiae]
MNTISGNPVSIPVSPAVLLCFLPSATTQDGLRERAFMTDLTFRLQQRLPGSVRILKVDEALHPEVVKSFHLSQLPAFVLVQQGIERWRQEGVRRFDELTSLSGMLETMYDE